MFHRSRRGTPRARASLLFATAAATVLTAVAGCAAGPAPRPGAQPAAPTTATAAQWTAALAALVQDGPAERDQWQLFRAQQTLVGACMRQQGLPYTATDPGPAPVTGATTADTAGTAQPPTYGITVRPDAAEAGSVQDRYLRSLDSARQANYLTAYRGSDAQSASASLTLPSGAVVRYGSGGCEGRARAALFGSVQAALEDTLVPQDVNQGLAAYLVTDRPYQAALAAWHTCTVRAGSPAQSPAAAIRALQAEAVSTTTAASPADSAATAASSAPGPPSATAAGQANQADLADRQHAEAAADLRCDAQTGLRNMLARERAAFLHRQPLATIALLAMVEQTRHIALGRLPAVG